MSAPKRWLEDGGGATHGERDLLRAGRAHDPPPDAKAAVWASILTQIPPIPPLPGPAGPAPGSGVGGAKAASAAGAKAAAAGGSATIAAAASGGLLKSALIGAGSAVALIATYTAVAPSQPANPPPPAVQTAAPQTPAHRSAPATAPGPQTTSAPAVDGAPTPPGTPAITDSPGATPSAEVRAATPAPGIGEPLKGHGATSISASSSGSTAMDRETRLLEESRRLTEARDALRRGDASGALSRLEELQRAVPGGILGQEREALAIEALARSGRSAEAQVRARAFLQAYPQSPHATRVEAFAR
jgi:hypothetical protein